MIAQELREQCILRMEESLERILKCTSTLQENQLWLRPNPSSNSVGNLVLHLCGNVRQYAISALGATPDHRSRSTEFAATDGYTLPQLQQMITTTIHEAITTIRTTTDVRLLHIHSVQGFQLSGIGIIIHVTEHLSYHTGQIAFYTKLLTNTDLGFYAGMDLEVKNEEG